MLCCVCVFLPSFLPSRPHAKVRGSTPRCAIFHRGGARPRSLCFCGARRLARLRRRASPNSLRRPNPLPTERRAPLPLEVRALPRSLDPLSAVAVVPPHSRGSGGGGRGGSGSGSVRRGRSVDVHGRRHDSGASAQLGGVRIDDPRARRPSPDADGAATDGRTREAPTDTREPHDGDPAKSSFPPDAPPTRRQVGGSGARTNRQNRM